MRRWWVLASTLVAALAVGTTFFLRGRSGPPAAAPSPASIRAATFVGGEKCRTCHGREHALWRGSHHDLAMQEATPETVLGNFDDARFTYHGVTSTFFRKDGRFWVRTDGPDGKLRDFPIAYTFGVDPLQQYLIAFPRGRYQALNICWDTRPSKDGGQRWFHLYPDENVSAGHIFHWTGGYQNWNFMCAECHSTNVRKGYNAADDSYRTTFSEIDVSCEACHGPGSEHVAWGQARRGQAKKGDGGDGLVIHLKDPTDSAWLFDPSTGIARRNQPRTSHVEVEMCARCHSRRGVVDANYVWGRPLMDSHRPVRIDSTLYHADGQINDEDYEYQSFLQSRMYAEGVTCSDCHNPHSLKLSVSSDAVCGRCHLPRRYETPSHHFHKASSPGASCVACHMPQKNYMVVHRRHDHSFRVPRPDLSVKIGTPNSCTACHRDKPAGWAARAALRWWGPRRPSMRHYGEAIHAGRETRPGAGAALVELASDASQPAIVRASAIALMRGFSDPALLPAVETSLSDPDPLVRDAAVFAASGRDPAERLRLFRPLLRDPIRTVRIDAARALSDAPRGPLSMEDRAALETGIAEYRASQLLDADRPEAHLNLGTLAVDLGNLAGAEAEYKTALKLEPRFPSTYVNLADLYRLNNRDDEGEELLRRGLAIAAETADIEHAYGLLLARQKRLPEALEHLRRAAEQRPQESRYGYVYAIALESAGQTDRALWELEGVEMRHPGDAGVLFALATIHRDRGDLGAATRWAEKLAVAAPNDPGARQLLDALRSARNAPQAERPRSP